MPAMNKPITTKQPSIAVYGIYRNEQKSIERFLDSVQPADEIVLCDTGSDDNTNQIISQYKECHPQVNLQIYSICVSPWRFDDARNTALSLVSPTIDLCLALDIDECLMNGWKTHLLSYWEPGYTKYYHKFKTIWSTGNLAEHWHERIHARAGYTWKLPIWEILEYNGPEKIKWLPDFWVYHRPVADKPRVNYLPLLEQAVKERPAVWKSWCFLANEYLTAGRYEEARKAVDKALDLETSDKGYLYKMKYLIYKAQNQVNLALINLNNMILHLSDRREAYFEKAVYLHQLGRHHEAFISLQEGKKITARIIDYHYNPAAWDNEFEHWEDQLGKLAGKEGVNIE